MSNRSSTEILGDIKSQSLDARIVRSRRLGILAEIERRELLATSELCTHAGEGDPENIGNALSYPFNYATGTKIIEELLRLRLALEILESSDAYAISRDALDPLFVELAEAEVREQAEREAVERAEQALREATETARLKAEATVAKDAAVKAAAAEVERLKAKHPEHVATPEPVKPTILETYHGKDAADPLAGDFHD